MHQLWMIIIESRPSFCFSLDEGKLFWLSLQTVLRQEGQLLTGCVRLGQSGNKGTGREKFNQIAHFV